jgi:hypothetical protein
LKFEFGPAGGDGAERTNGFGKMRGWMQVVRACDEPCCFFAKRTSGVSDVRQGSKESSLRRIVSSLLPRQQSVVRILFPRHFSEADITYLRMPNAEHMRGLSDYREIPKAPGMPGILIRKSRCGGTSGSRQDRRPQCSIWTLRSKYSMVRSNEVFHDLSAIR